MRAKVFSWSRWVCSCLRSGRFPPAGRRKATQKPVDLVAEGCRRLRRGRPADLAQLQLQLQTLRRLTCRHRLSRGRHPNLIRPRAAFANAHAASLASELDRSHS